MRDPQQWGKSTLRNRISFKPLPSTENGNTSSLQRSSRHVSTAPFSPHSITCLGSQYLVGGTEEKGGERSHSHFFHPQELGERERPQDFKPSLVFRLLLGIDILVNKLGSELLESDKQDCGSCLSFYSETGKLIHKISFKRYKTVFHYDTMGSICVTLVISWVFLQCLFDNQICSLCGLCL